MAQWLEAAVAVRPELLEALTVFFTDAAPCGFVIEDAAEVERFLQSYPDRWDYVDDAVLTAWQGVSRVKCYLPAEEPQQLDALRAGLDALAVRLGCSASEFVLTAVTLESADWENNWKQYYRPLLIGERLYILPAWDSAPAPAGRMTLRLDPGLAFGTGNHASTRLCLEAAETILRPGAHVLDIGCGSGILALAALRLGAASAVGCDIREETTAVAAENARLNGLDPFPVHIGNILTDPAIVQAMTTRPADLIFANIVADVILPLSRHARHWLADGGVFLCSGIIDTRADEVADTLRQNGFTLRQTLSRDGWYAFICV